MDCFKDFPVYAERIELNKELRHEQNSLLVFVMGRIAGSFFVAGEYIEAPARTALVVDGMLQIETTGIAKEVEALRLGGELVSSLFHRMENGPLYVQRGLIYVRECLAVLDNEESGALERSTAAYRLLMQIQKEAVNLGKNPNEAKYPPLVDAALGIICHETATIMSIEEVAERVGSSLSYLSREFKKAVGVSPSRYLRQLKINNAKEMLRDRSLSLELIAEMTGYADADYFCRVFKTETGVTPTAYRLGHVNRSISHGDNIPASYYL